MNVKSFFLTLRKKIKRAVIVLVICLFVNLLKPDKKESKKESPTATATNATTEAVNPDLELSKEAKAIYERNKSLLVLVNKENLRRRIIPLNNIP